MKNFIFVTGNEHKALYLKKWLGRVVEHKSIDLDELQSLDLKTVVEHKARQAYGIINSPVLVEDVAVTFPAMGRLPGTLIKWFLQELGNDGLCKLVGGLDNRQAEVLILYGLFDGKTLHYFDGQVKGRVAESPRGHEGFGWNPIFIPDGSTKTYAEMVDEELMPYSHRAQAVAKLRAYLEQVGS